MTQSLKDMLMDAPSGHMDISIKRMIDSWDEDPTASQLLETLDVIVYTSGASGFVIQILNVLLKEALTRENTTYEDITVIANNTWRKKLN